MPVSEWSLCSLSFIMMTPRNFFLLSLSSAAIAFSAEALLKPGPPVDGTNIVFYPKNWEKAKLKPQLVPWEGKNITFLTTDAQLDPAMVTHFVACLDKGWETYANLTGAKPNLFKNLNGKPTVTAVPAGELTCGAGCGYIGATGVELAMFYDHNVAAWKKDPQNFPHYGFYELGRNFYTFKDRHSCFITGYAVFMRYVCMDAAKCHDVDLATRTHIERMEEVYAASSEPFLRTFTMLDGYDEKTSRLKDANGKTIPTSDQPVMYATAMLKLRRDYGGNAWIKKFFTALAKCPEVNPTDKAAAQRQCLAWLVCASVAAGKDLTPVFCDRWRMELPAGTRAAFKAAPWGTADFDFIDLLK
jgi:hypothetical protein